MVLKKKKDQYSHADSVSYQALKQLSKTAKLVKGLLIRKVVRKSKSDGIDVDENHELKLLKYVNHQTIADAALKIITANVVIPSNTAYDSCMKKVLSHTKMGDAMAFWKVRIQSIQNKIMTGSKVGNERSQEKATSKKSNKSRIMSSSSKAVFLECLADDDAPKKSAARPPLRRRPVLSETLSRYVPDRERPTVLRPPLSSRSPSETTWPVANHNARMVPTRRPQTLVPASQQLSVAVRDGKNWKEGLGVHPSWAAKQLSKQQVSAVSVPFQGKKIVFKED